VKARGDIRYFRDRPYAGLCASGCVVFPYMYREKAIFIEKRVTLCFGQDEGIHEDSESKSSI